MMKFLLVFDANRKVTFAGDFPEEADLVGLKLVNTRQGKTVVEIVGTEAEVQVIVAALSYHLKTPAATI